MKFHSESMTQRIIELHHSGYELDFQLDGDDFICLQSNERFNFMHVNVSWSGTDIDINGKVVRFIHSIACTTGQKGIFLCTEIFKRNV